MAARLATLLATAAVVVGLAGAAGAAQAESPRVAASAFAVRVVVPGQEPSLAGAISAPPDASTVSGGFAFPADGSVVSVGQLTASTTAAGGARAEARAAADIASVSLFGGEITADSVAARATAIATSTMAGGDFGGTALARLVVLGQAVTASPNLRVPLADWGYAVVSEQALVRRTPSSPPAHRGFVTALRVVLTADHGGLPAGSEIHVGYAEAAAQATPPPPPRTTTAESKPGGAKARPQAPPARKPPAAKKRAQAPAKERPEPKNLRPGTLAPLTQLPPPDVTPKLTAGGYVFPVYGPASYSNTFGAPRAHVSGGWHHGVDVFAPLGAPVLAVAHGTVYSVGWNDVGGWRLWLRDRKGNEFYYAHLSAYSTLAFNGARVRAGDVLGFVGNTGDAVGTPYHLHFEVHPVTLLFLGYDGAVDPTGYLDAWRRLEDVRFVPAAAGFATPPAASVRLPEPGAILLQSSDISTADGLEPGSLARALRPVEVSESAGIGGLPSPLPRLLRG